MSRGWFLYYTLFLVWCTGFFLYAVMNLIQLITGTHSGNELGGVFLVTAWVIHLLAAGLQGYFAVYSIRKLMKKSTEV